MRHSKDPRQTSLFDPFARVFSEVAYRRVRRGWWEVFRHCILKLMPVDALEDHFDPSIGRPTKELYSIAGLLLIKEFHDWTEEQAVDAYLFHAEIQYALNLEPASQSLSVRTVQRYERLFRDSDLAARVMREVTVRLVAELDQDVSRQRLDSTHCNSDMAIFGRTRLMGVAVKRFLTQVKRHDPHAYEALPEALRKRYEPSPGRLFASIDKTDRSRLRLQVAQDMHELIERFADNERIEGRQTYKSLVRIFEQQCEVQEDAVVIKSKAGGRVIQNPSDPDATYDGKKGPGYQLQVCETCADDNEEQLVTSARLETAADSDQDALVPILEDLESKGCLPERLDADAGYGSDSNVCAAAAKGVDLQSPVAGCAVKGDGNFALSVDDFVIEPETETVQRCPQGHEPLISVHDREAGITKTVMPPAACAGCPFGGECPIKMVNGEFRLHHTPKERRLAERRREQATEAFQQNYRKRAGGESINSALKRRMGLARLRVRGRRAVAHAVYLRIAGWNILRAAASSKLHAKLQAAAQRAVAALNQVSSTCSTGASGLTAGRVIDTKISALWSRRAFTSSAKAA